MNKQKTLYFFLLILLLIGLVTSPFWLWQLKGSKELNILIMDKTVPDETYREHNGLVWILNNQKYKKPNGDSYYTENDYKGFKPISENEYKVSELPEDLSKYDLIYLADQYGVYEEEFYGSNTLGERSDMLYGGLEIEDVTKIEDSLYQSDNKTLIAEFNTFASPTSDEAQEKITNILDVKWSGWIGRHFTDLTSDEVPIWVKDNYESTNDRTWNFTGPGIVLVNKDDYIVVLNGSELKEDSKVAFDTTETGESLLQESLKSEYGYWFDIVEANHSNGILAQYTLPVTEEGETKLEGYGIPSEFPAIIQNKNQQYTSYYFAGDYADEGEVPNLYRTVGFDSLKRYITFRNSFYWNTYVPLMKDLLKYGLHEENVTNNVETLPLNDLTVNSRTNQDFIQVQEDGKWKDLVIKGVNMGISKPGSFPGETAITKEEYSRWFKQIGAMNANAIRVYTLHPPAFYEAFYEYNQTAEEPLYLFHGAWVNEEIFTEHQDAYATEVQEDFQTEIKNMVDIIHGNANLPEKTGHASGEYTYDISPYVLGFIIGIEWDPDVVENTDSKNKGMSQFSGQYFTTTDASPFEIWLAKMMDYTSNYEAEEYKWQHTMSFTNWVTTDLLEHPAEPSIDEDKATVDPNHIKATDNFQAGLFASYHIYPYYPDFLNYEESYQEYVNKQGEKSSYAAYLNELRAVHDMPVLVAEFGVPASRGKTHENINGMNQGFISEEQQGTMDAEMLQMIVDENYAGGLVFTWQDEWFKRTWNTMDYDNADRRPYWSNIQTNEQHFGLLSFDPGQYEPTIYIDGSTLDWEKMNVKPMYEDSSNNAEIKAVMVTSDEQQISIKVDFQNPVDTTKDSMYILFDTIQNQGQNATVLSNGETIQTDFGVDFVANIQDEDHSSIEVDSYYDAFYYQYSHLLKMLKEDDYVNEKNNGVYHPIRLALNKELAIGDTNIPFSSYETGKLLFGNGNPSSKNFNSLTDISFSSDHKTMEMRIPWALLNIKDPSQKEIMGNLWKSGLTSSETIEGIQMAFLQVKDDNTISALPNLEENNTILYEDMQSYTWDNWEEPAYHERLKQSYYILQEALSNIAP